MSDSITEVRIIKAVVCYDLLHKDITKPVTIMQTNSGTPENPDPLFRGIDFDKFMAFYLFILFLHLKLL